MSLSALTSDIAEGVRGRPGRFVLALFAMTIGMAVLTLLIALLGGLEQRSQALSAQLGTDVIAILPASDADRSSLSDRHPDLVRRNFPGADVSGMRVSSAAVAGRGGNVTVVAVEERFFTLRQWPLRAGRFLDAEDLDNRRRHALVTDALLQQQGWQLGQTIALRETPFQIVGVVGANDAALNGEYGDQRLSTGERAVFVPLSVAPRWDSTAGTGAPLDALYVRPAAGMTAGTLLPALQNLLGQPDLDLPALSWVIPASLIRKVRDMQGTVGLTVGTIAVLALVLGGTTLTSLLVANVRERIAEIGLRRAMGATQWDIATLFMAEGCAATVGAALVGTCLVHGVLLLDLPLLNGLPLQLGLQSLALPVLFALALGALFSAWPALSAAQIQPADALRND
jgi:putative ABC transport system permease protein